jgi:hypothetical protein
VVVGLEHAVRMVPPRARPWWRVRRRWTRTLDDPGDSTMRTRTGLVATAVAFVVCALLLVGALIEERRPESRGHQT